MITTDAFGRITGVTNAAISGSTGSAAPQIFTLHDTGNLAQWVKLGTFNASQQGYDVDKKIVTSNGYNASILQDQVSYIHFKSSNASSLNSSGFAGDSWWYQTGPNTSAPSQVVWVANAAGVSATAFTLYAYFGLFTGGDSYYVVDVPPGTTWTNIAVGGQATPGSGSSTVLIAQNGMYVGNLLLAPNGGGSITFQDGTVQSTAYTGVTCGGDYAESVDVAGDRKSYEPGDVLVIGAENGSDVLKSAEPYSTLVAGIYSTKPGVVGRRQTTDPKASTAEVPMAMVGIVPTKVSAENGPIKRGDLLVTSSTLGYAMKGTDRSRMESAKKSGVRQGTTF